MYHTLIIAFIIILFKVKASGETKYIDGEEFEDNGKTKVKFYLNNVDDKERVCITNERTDDKMCRDLILTEMKVLLNST